MLTEEELPPDAISDCRIFHFGTLSMTHEGVRKATCKAIDLARESGALISFDPNLRPPLWSSLKEARAQIEYGLARCDILKIADNELEFMTGEADFDRGAAILRGEYPNIRLLNVTAGADGSYYYYEDKRRNTETNGKQTAQCLFVRPGGSGRIKIYQITNRKREEK